MEDKHPCIHEIGDLLPITKEVLKYRKVGKYRFHTPGHKGRGHFLPEVLDVACDVTEVADMDNLLSPCGCIKKSLDEAAKRLRVNAAYFITSGATTGILAACFAVKDYGRIAYLRSSHQSVYNASEITSVEPMIIDDADIYGNAKKVTIDLIADALKANDVGTILLQYPDYLGNAFDLKKISKEIKKNGKILILDASHGAHFPFSPLFPESPEKYADIFVYSAHKTLPVLTGGAILCVANEEFITSCDKAFHLFHTTSPNYQIMMSLEYGIYVYSDYKEQIKELKKNVDSMKKTLISSDVAIMPNDDFTRLVIDTLSMEISGKELDMRLNEKGIFAEFSSMDKVVFIITCEDEKEDLTYLTKELIIAVEQCGKISKKQYLFPKSKESSLPYVKAVNMDSERVLIENAVGRIAAKNFGVYPPCMPICVAGEKITQEMIDYLSFPLDFYGISEGKLTVIKK